MSGLFCVSHSPLGKPVTCLPPAGESGGLARAPPGLSRLGQLSPAGLRPRVSHAAGRRHAAPVDSEGSYRSERHQRAHGGQPADDSLAKRPSLGGSHHNILPEVGT